MGEFRDDILFTANDLTNGGLVVRDASVGAFSIEDGNGEMVLVPQRASNGDVLVDFSGFVISGVWKIRFPRGERGINTTGGITAEEAMLYALVFG